VAAAGTIGFDDLTTPGGRASQVPGGSALYFTLAARGLCAVRPVAALGQDGSELLRLLEEAGIDPVGVESMAGPSYRWTATHSEGGALESQLQHLGVYEEWHPRVPEVCRSSEILFLGSMPPRVQLAVMGQCSGADLVAIDTMGDFIASDRALLLELIKAADIFFANRAELEALLGGGAAINRARSLLEADRLRAVVVKEGPQGATLVTRLGHQLVPAAPVDPVVDPTGAGDALAGGMLGRLAQLRSSSEEALRLGLAEGVRTAALAVSAFSVRGLLGPARG
jgi:sugar/nucleoside kinase (ribokinase family)